MTEAFFSGLFDTDLTRVIAPTDFLLCLGTALGLGLLLAGAYGARGRRNSGFLLTLGLLPAVVCVVIMMVNGNVGTGVAVAGAFSLVRFRSVPGTAKEICALFAAMGSGLMAGMGYLGYGLLFTAVLAGLFLLLGDLGTGKNRRRITVTIPEDLDYTGVFDDLFRQHLKDWELVRVKSTNMGSLFKLTYEGTLKDPAAEKPLLDGIRCRNGNLEITVSRPETEVGL